jgi:hypothetical protein
LYKTAPEGSISGKKREVSSSNREESTATGSSTAGVSALSLLLKHEKKRNIIRLKNPEIRCFLSS